jgi:hypothetical protein
LPTYLGGLKRVVGRKVNVEEEDGAAIGRVICMEKKGGHERGRGGDTLAERRRKRRPG